MRFHISSRPSISVLQLVVDQIALPPYTPILTTEPSKSHPLSINLQPLLHNIPKLWYFESKHHFDPNLGVHDHPAEDSLNLSGSGYLLPLDSNLFRSLYSSSSTSTECTHSPFTQTPESPIKESNHRRISVSRQLKTLAAVVFTFLSCWVLCLACLKTLPYLFVNLWDATILTICRTPIILGYVCYILYWISVFILPWTFDVVAAVVQIWSSYVVINFAIILLN